jgi:hypothetical protein
MEPKKRSLMFFFFFIIGPFVQLSSESVNFMQIDSGQTGTRTIDVINNSDVDAQFQVNK